MIRSAILDQDNYEVKAAGPPYAQERLPFLKKNLFCQKVQKWEIGDEVNCIIWMEPRTNELLSSSSSSGVGAEEVVEELRRGGGSRQRGGGASSRGGEMAQYNRLSLMNSIWCWFFCLYSAISVFQSFSIFVCMAADLRQFRLIKGIYI